MTYYESSFLARCIRFTQRKTNLTRVASLIAQKIIEEGKIFAYKFSPTSKPFPVMDVHFFLNHRIEPELMQIIGEDLARIVKPYKPELIITAATSGIAPTQETVRHLNNVPYIFARKEASITFRDGIYKVGSFSISRGQAVDLYISQQCLKPRLRIAIIDDFLDMGILAKNLLNVIHYAGCSIETAAFVIEKTESGGRKKLIRAGLSDNRIHSLLKISRLAAGKMQIATLPYWLSLKNK